MPVDLSGVIAPVLTPFDDEGDLVEDQIAQSVAYTLDSGCHAIVAAGTGVQETTMVTPEERKTIMTETVAAVDDAVPVLAGVSYPAQSVTTELVQHAEDLGADALLAMPPWGVGPSADDIVRYIEGIADTTTLPILVYNNPAVTVDMAKETMARLAREIDAVAYVKESSRDWTKLAWLFERIHHEGHADVFTTMDVFLPTLQTVNTGIITPPPLTIPSMQIYDAFTDGDIDRAVDHQRTFGDFPTANIDAGLTAVCKQAAELAGVPVGPPRAPYSSVAAHDIETVAAWMDDAGVPRTDH